MLFLLGMYRALLAVHEICDYYPSNKECYCMENEDIDFTYGYLSSIDRLEIRGQDQR
jgi:hypothetical protein